jgi:hypothetical protein
MVAHHGAQWKHPCITGGTKPNVSTVSIWEDGAMAYNELIVSLYYEVTLVNREYLYGYNALSFKALDFRLSPNKIAQWPGFKTLVYLRTKK